MNNILQQAQKMQSQLEKVQKELENVEGHFRKNQLQESL